MVLEMKNRLTILLACLLLVMLVPVIGAPVVAAQGNTIIVTSSADRGPGTLRQALQDAHSGDTITFDSTVFPPNAPATIYLESKLPRINQGNLKIDASNAGVILDGSNIGEKFMPCLQIISDGNAVHGLQFVNFTPGAGISLSSGAQHNLIGGDRRTGSGSLGQGNLVSRGDIGIWLGGDGTSFNTITGNLIGTDASGTDDWGNSGSGIWIEDGAQHNTIGPDNIIAYSNGHGIEIRDSNSLDNTITQNSIHDNEGKDICLWEEGDVVAQPPDTVRIVTSDEVWEDETITIEKKLRVERGASLTLRNVTLTFDNPTSSESGIVVYPGSSLAIYNSTLSRPSYLELGGFIIQVEENASFVMKNSVLDGASREGRNSEREWSIGSIAALTLDHVKGAVIEGNVMQNIQWLAIELHDVSDSVITNNTITPLHQVRHGGPVFLSMWDSRNNTITDNYITGVSKAILMNDHSTGNYVAGNEITPYRAGHLAMGITLEGDSNNNIFSDNKILGPSGCTAFRIFTRNNVITNNTISDMIYGIVIAGGADGNIVANNTLSQIHVKDAILLYRSNGNYVINNNISSSIRGISVSRFSCNNVVQANTISNSRQGILINSSSNNNLIVNNKVSKNKVGIMVYKSSENKIYDNSFIGNSQQGYDDGVNNWSWGNRGNYWSDNRGEGDTAYDIAPAGIDEQPLTESVPIVPVQIQEPAPLTFREVYQAPHERINDEVKYEDREILMENCYIIMDGGKLILENVTLRSFKEAALPYLIIVEDGGSLIISNSRIIAPETGIAPIEIEARMGSTLVIKDSEFHNVDAGMRDGGPHAAAIYILCEGAVVEGNIITGSRTGINIDERGGSSARIVNNTFEGCLEDVWIGSPFVSHVIEGNTIIDPVPAERLSGFWPVVAAMTYRMLLYWLRDPRVIAGISVISIGAITLGVLLFRRRRCRKAKATATG